MSSQNIVTVLVIIAVLVGGYYFFSGTPTTDDGADLTDEGAEEDEKMTEPSTTSSKSSGSGTVTVEKKSVTKSTDTSNALVPTSGTVVNYTSSGFNPSSVLINQGGVVTFINNNTGSAMRVKSVPDDAYSAFSQSYTVGKGGVFTFTFLKAGQWRYTNSNNTAHEGTILVVPQNP